MTLCFAAFITILKICAKPKVYNKTLCEAVVKTVVEYTVIGTDPGQISHLMSCDYNLSPKDVIQPVRDTALSKISSGMNKYVLPPTESGDDSAGDSCITGFGTVYCI